MAILDRCKSGWFFLFVGLVWLFLVGLVDFGWFGFFFFFGILEGFFD